MQTAGWKLIKNIQPQINVNITCVIHNKIVPYNYYNFILNTALPDCKHRHDNHMCFKTILTKIMLNCPTFQSILTVVRHNEPLYDNNNIKNKKHGHNSMVSTQFNMMTIKIN